MGEFFSALARPASMHRSETEAWALDQFGKAALGDARRTARLVEVAARAAERPSGKLSEVFESARELDAAYDFVEREQTKVQALQSAVGKATAERCTGDLYVSVPVDGSSLQLTDAAGEKDFGSIGTADRGARGLKVISALAVGADGVPIGLLAQTWWARPVPVPRSAKERRRLRTRKRVDEKETRHWLETIEQAAEQLNAVGARGWFQLDREADAWPTLLTLEVTGHRFTVRSAWDRLVGAGGHDKQYLRARLAATKPIGTFDLDVPASSGRSARRAHMVMHAAQATLQLRDRRTDRMRRLTIYAVWVYEQGTTPCGEKPLEWRLLTNAPIVTSDARIVVLGYSSRWRIEEFHKTWKTGGCNVEMLQLRSRNAVIRWATILAVVATRIERLKRLARAEVQRPATDELTEIEVEVLIALKRRRKKRTERMPDGMPTIAQAVGWIADIGGYTGKSSGGPPGAITIGRGLERLRQAVEGVLAMRGASE